MSRDGVAELLGVVSMKARPGRGRPRLDPGDARGDVLADGSHVDAIARTLSGIEVRPEDPHGAGRVLLAGPKHCRWEPGAIRRVREVLRLEREPAVTGVEVDPGLRGGSRRSDSSAGRADPPRGRAPRSADPRSRTNVASQPPTRAPTGRGARRSNGVAATLGVAPVGISSRSTSTYRSACTVTS